MNVLKKSDYTWEELVKKIKGSSFKGDFVKPYDELCHIFGDPSIDGDGYKVDAEWVIETEHGIATVYNYKNGPSYRGEGSIRDIRGWHVGSKSQAAAELILSLVRHSSTFS